MFKLKKYLKPFIGSILVILALLFLQANSELALPDYMSNIVNIGIQQGGIKDAVPEVIRDKELDKLSLLIDESDYNAIKDNYKLISKSNLSEDEYTKYLKDYPILDKENLYILNTTDKEVRNNISNKISKAELIVFAIENKSFETAGFTSSFNLPENADIFQVLKSMPKEQLKIILDKINEKFEEMPDSMISQSATKYVKNEYSEIGINTDKIQSNYILLSGAKMLGISLLIMIATILVGLLSARIAASVSKTLRKDVFERVSNFSNAEFDKYSTASLITRTTNDIQQVQILIQMIFRIVFYAPVLGIGGILKVLKTDTSMTWIIGLSVIVISIIMGILFSFAIPRFKKVQKLVDRINLVMRESLNGILVIRAFSTQKYEENKFDNANKDLTSNSLVISRLMTFMMPAMTIVMNLTILLIVWVGSHQVDIGSMQVGDMMAFMQYAIQIIMSFLMISMVSIILPRASVSAQRISEVLETDISIVDKDKTVNFDKDETGLVEFDNVSFKYPNADDYVLKNISFVAKPGETTAIIGSTGSGKSTLINLIPRFYDVTKGKIFVNGKNVKDVKQKTLRDEIGLVPQKGLLFSGTIESNLKYGNKEASDNEIKKAAEISQSLDFIEKKTEGFKSEISQGGTNVSGGQKQRLSIARALAKKPNIFIFDDSFSALDFKTDSMLRKALKENIKEATILIVGQRISSIKDANQIIVLDNGEIVGKGTHKELLETCEVYKEIALSQLSKEELMS